MCALDLHKETNVNAVVARGYYEVKKENTFLLFRPCEGSFDFCFCAFFPQHGFSESFS